MSSVHLLNMNMNEKIYIYCATPVCEYIFQNLNGQNLEKIVNYDMFKTIDSPNKFAIFHTPHLTRGNKIFEQIPDLLQYSKKIFVFTSEVLGDQSKFIKEFQNPKIVHFTCGFVTGVETYKWMDWLITTSAIYKEKPEILDSLTPYKPKSKFFDALLGQRKEHREYVYDFFSYNNLQDKVVMTYMQRGVPLLEQSQTGYIWDIEDFSLPEQNIYYTIESVVWKNYPLFLSQVVPVKIYNQTAYSIVTETSTDNISNFYTEKIVKPILAERLFLCLSSQYYLKNLRNLGFKTFHGIIDETYDNIADSKLRYCMIFDQIRYLLDTPQEEILEKIKPITEHNKKVLLETDWFGDTMKILQDEIFSVK